MAKHLFKDVPIGFKFFEYKTSSSGFESNILKWFEYEKIDKSHAKIIKQVNYGNNRLVNTVQPFGPYKTIFDL